MLMDEEGKLATSSTAGVGGSPAETGSSDTQVLNMHLFLYYFVFRFQKKMQ